MITIKYPAFTTQVENWKDQLEELVAAHQLIEDTSINAPILKDSSQTFTGNEAINEYVSSLMEYQKAWFACACG